jgi:hypothetical protein
MAFNMYRLISSKHSHNLLQTLEQCITFNFNDKNVTIVQSNTAYSSIISLHKNIPHNEIFRPEIDTTKYLLNNIYVHLKIRFNLLNA